MSVIHALLASVVPMFSDLHLLKLMKSVTDAFAERKFSKDIILKFQNLL